MRQYVLIRLIGGNLKMAAATTTDYYLAFQFYQSAAGGENARIKISHMEFDYEAGYGDAETVLVDNYEITSSDPSAPVTVFVTAPDCVAPGSKLGDEGSPVQTLRIRVTLLNDYYLDASNDRAITWTYAGYAPKWMWTAGDGDRSKVYKGPLSAIPAEGTADYNVGADANFTIVSDFADLSNYNTCSGAEYTGDENGAVATNAGWHKFLISTDYVEAQLPVPMDGVWTY